MFELFSLGDAKNMESALNVCTPLFLHITDLLGPLSDKISSVLQAAMEQNNYKLQVSATQALGSLITTLPPKEVKKYFKFSIPVLKILHEMFFAANGNIDYACTVLEVVGEIVETDPKFFRAVFRDLINLMKKIRDLNSIEGAVKDQSLEISISMAQRYPEFLKENKEVLSTIVEMVFLHMLEIPDECPAEWINPPDGFDPKKMEDDSQKAVSFSTDCIDRLCSHVGEKVMLKYLGDCVAQLLATGEWKKVFASFMALSQIGEYMEDVAEIKPIVIKLQEYAAHPEPRVRYAVVHCLGQISDDFAPKFEDFYHQDVLPLFLERLQDPIPRVVAHTCASLTNFLERCQPDHVAPFFETFYSKITSIIDQASIFVKENALSTLSTLSVGAPELFMPHYDFTMEVLLKILVQVNDRAYKRLRGNSIECISVISQEIGIDKFQPFADRLISAMINIQEHYLDKEEDPQRNFILLAWPRISHLMKGQFSAYIPRVVPSLLVACLAVAENTPEKAIDVLAPSADEETDQKDDYHTYLDEECNNALTTVANFMEDCPAAMAPFIEEVYKIVTPLMNYETNDDVRTTAAECLPAMILCVKENPDFAKDLPLLTKDFITKLWESMDEESEPEVLIKQATCMQEIVTCAGDVMSPEDLDRMLVKCLEHLKRSDDRKKDTDKQIDEEEDEVEVLEIHEEEKDLEDQLHCTIAEIFGKLYMTHKQKALPIFQKVHQLFIATSLQGNQSDMIKKFGLFLICDSVDHLGLLLSPELLQEYYQYLKKYSSDKHIFVRHAAVYGIGSMALALKDQWFGCLDDSLQTLRKAMKMKRGEEEEDIFKSTMENCASALGKIIKVTYTQISQEVKISLVNEWIEKLPLKLDQVEAVVSHTFLVDLLESDRNIVLNKIENLEKTLNIIATVWKTKASTHELDARMSTLLRAWSSEQVMVEAIGKVQLSEKKRSFIERALQE